MSVPPSKRRRQRLLVPPELFAPGRSLEETLTDVATHASRVFQCRHALLVLFDGDSFGAFGAAGLTSEERARIASAPQGHGVFRELTRHQSVLRIDDIAGHPAAEGFPEGHPPMTSGLGIRLDGQAGPLGLLLLADPLHGGPFTAEDEDLLASFAPAAETAAQNAVLLRDARMAQRWSQAAAEYMRDLLVGAVDEPLSALSATALELAEAEAIVMLVHVDPEHLQVLHAQGGQGEDVIGAVFPYPGSVSEEVITSGKGLVLAELDSAERSPVPGVERGALGPTLMLPLRGSEKTRGTVALMRARGSRRFAQADLATAQAFADLVTVALELAAARDIQQRLDKLKAEHRVARDLHDQVVQRLFASGLSFQQALPEVEGRARERLEAGMLSLEETVQEIRDKILSLRRDRDLVD